MNFNYIKVCSATPEVIVADCHYNTEQILTCIKEADKNKAELLVFPELSISGYSCGDLFYQQPLLDESINGLLKIVEISKETSMIICVGFPLRHNNKLFNCAAVIKDGTILGIVPKTKLNNKGYNFEDRWFSPSYEITSPTISLFGDNIPFSPYIIFQANNNSYFTIGVEICEDSNGPIAMSNYHSLAGANIIVNLSANPNIAGSFDKRLSTLEELSSNNISGYIYASAGTGESTTDLVYPSHNLILENGSLLEESRNMESGNKLIYSLIDVERLSIDRSKASSFSMPISNKELFNSYIKVQFTHTSRPYNFNRPINSAPFVPNKGRERDLHCLDVFTLQTLGLAKRIKHIGCKNLVIGVSGGLDSTLALLVCVKAFNRLGLDLTGIIGVTMPGFGTTDRTYKNSISLMKNLGVTIKEISIVDATIQHFKDIGHDINSHDITYENSQARERTQILMDIANKVNGIVVGTGDLSELALGWATYNGDHMSMYAVNIGVPKTLVKFLIEWAANNQFDDDTKEVLMDIFNTPVSPELLPPSSDGNIQQKTEEIVGPYELHDFFLYYLLNYGFRPSKIAMLAENAFEGQYNRNTIIKYLKVFYRRFFTQQFKRSALPDGPQVESVSFSPRTSWKMPSDASYNLWIDEINLL